MTYPSVIAIFGSLGLGLVWGWLIGMLDYRLHKSVLTFLAVLLSSIIIAAQIIWFLDLIRLSFFIGAVLVAFIIQIGWRSKMIRHEGL